MNVSKQATTEATTMPAMRAANIPEHVPVAASVAPGPGISANMCG